MLIYSKLKQLFNMYCLYAMAYYTYQCSCTCFIHFLGETKTQKHVNSMHENAIKTHAYLLLAYQPRFILNVIPKHVAWNISVMNN